MSLINSINPLVTLWAPNPNPLGTASLVALAIGGTLAALAGQVSPLPWAKKRAVVAAAPWLLLVMCAFTQGSILYTLWGRFRVFPDGEDYAAEIVYLAFGFGLGLANFRFLAPANRLSAVLSTFATGSLIAWRAVDELEAIVDVEFWPMLPLFLVAWGFVAWLAYRRSAERWGWYKRGVCLNCGYDLRASPEQCPECGRIVRQPVVAKH